MSSRLRSGILLVGHEATRTGVPMELLHFLRWFKVHKWMCDCYSLAMALKFSGIVQKQLVGPTQSRVPNSVASHLNTDPDGGTQERTLFTW